MSEYPGYTNPTGTVPDSNLAAINRAFGQVPQRVDDLEERIEALESV